MGTPRRLDSGSSLAGHARNGRALLSAVCCLPAAATMMVGLFSRGRVRSSRRSRLARVIAGCRVQCLAAIVRGFILTAGNRPVQSNTYIFLSKPGKMLVFNLTRGERWLPA